MNPKVKSLYTMFVNNHPMPVEAEGLSDKGSPWLRVKHGCDKTFLLYFNAENVKLHQGHGCVCKTLYDDIAFALGTTDIPWAKSEGQPASDGRVKPIIPAPLIPTDDTFKTWAYDKVMPPTKFYTYRTLHKEVIGWIARYTNPADPKDKQFRQWFVVDRGEGPEFVYNSASKKDPRSAHVDYNKHMLYGLEYYDPARPTLFVEGEKAADAAFKLLPKWNILTWSHGVKALRDIDFSFMKGQSAVYWPDNDEAGIESNLDLANALAKYDIRLKTVFDKISNLPKKWDLADDQPPGLDIEALIEKATDVKTTAKSNDYILMLNENYRRIQLGNDTLYVDLRPNKEKSNGLFYTLTKPSSMYINHPYKIDVPGVKAKQSVINVWLEKIDTPILTGITFDPSAKERIIDNKLNNFVGFPFSPVKPNRQVHKELYAAYKLFCDIVPDRAQRNWIFDYVADIFQNPTKKPPTFLVLVGDQGVGKSLIVEVARRIVGNMRYCASTRIDTEVKFNSMESGVLLLYQDEVRIGGKGASGLYDRLKNQITQSVKTVERKGIAIVEEPSYERRIFTSNHDEPFRIAYDDRRTTIVRVNPKHKGNHAAFVPFLNILKSTELAEGLMWFFTKRKIKSVLMQGLMSDEKRALVGYENKFIEVWENTLQDCELPQWLAELFIPADQEVFGFKNVHMGRAVFIDKVSRHFGNDAWLTKSVKAKMYELFLYDDEKRRHEQRPRYVDQFGNTVTTGNAATVFEFATWEVMRKRFDTHIGAVNWKPLRKIQFKAVEGGKADTVVNLRDDKPKKDIL